MDALHQPAARAASPPQTDEERNPLRSKELVDSFGSRGSNFPGEGVPNNERKGLQHRSPNGNRQSPGAYGWAAPSLNPQRFKGGIRLR